MTHSARLGLKFFVVYATVYFAFVMINAFSPETMERTPWAGVSLAVTSGFGLIGFAFVLSLIYGVMCAAADRKRKTSQRSQP